MLNPFAFLLAGGSLGVIAILFQVQNMLYLNKRGNLNFFYVAVAMICGWLGGMSFLVGLVSLIVKMVLDSPVVH